MTNQLPETNTTMQMDVSLLVSAQQLGELIVGVNYVFGSVTVQPTHIDGGQVVWLVLNDGTDEEVTSWTDMADLAASLNDLLVDMDEDDAAPPTHGDVDSMRELATVAQNLLKAKALIDAAFDEYQGEVLHGFVSETADQGPLQIVEDFARGASDLVAHQANVSTGTSWSTPKSYEWDCTCGTRNSKNVEFCPNPKCGRDQDGWSADQREANRAAADGWACRGCGTENAGDDDRCSKCGAEIGGR